VGRAGAAALLAAAALVGPARLAAGEAPAACPGDRIDADAVVTGSFTTDLRGSYVMVPFDVPKGTTAVRVKYCYDRADVESRTRHTLDLGLYSPRTKGDDLWGPAEFRGWGGSSHPDVTISERGFSTQAQYLDDPKGDVPGRTTRGFIPGKVPAGEWAAELGVASVTGADEGDADGAVAWRIEIAYDGTGVKGADRYRPAPYSTEPVRTKPGWYAGDLHVHAENSALGDATMQEVFAYAFRPVDEGGAGLDFLTLTDYVGSIQWDEIGRYQAEYPRDLIVRGAEVITYRGHTNNQASATYVDHRTGPVFEWHDDGSVTLLRAARPASEIFDDVHAGGGWTQINHPKIFPSDNPVNASLCRGCSWDYSDTETDFSKVDAIEVTTGPAGLGEGATVTPVQFALDAIAYWERALATGAHVAAVAASDSHTGGETEGPIDTPVGTPTTVVYARQLSETGVRAAVRGGHTYVKLFGNAGPDLRLTATTPAGGKPAIIGDTVRAPAATFRARVLGAADGLTPATGPYRLVVKKDGVQLSSTELDGPDTDQRFESSGPGRYNLELWQGPLIVGLTSPIYLEG
jgi:hypothetical protein